MGVNYWVVPVVRDAARLRAMAGAAHRGLLHRLRVIDMDRWIADLARGLDPAAEGRFPTLLEVRMTLRRLAGLRYRIAQHVPPDGGLGWWGATVYTYLDAFRHSNIQVDRYDGSEAASHALYFEKGDWDLNLLLTEEIARVCGPLLFWPNSEDAPTHLLPGYEKWAFRAAPDRGRGRLVRWTTVPSLRDKAYSPLVPYPDPDYNGLVAYLYAIELPRPALAWRGRLPTYGELASVLESMQPWAQLGLQYEGGGFVRSTLYIGDGGARRPVVRLVYQDWSSEEERQPGDDDEPVTVAFEGGELRVEATIIERLAQHCGPQVLLAPHGSPVPLVVQAGDDPDRLVARWERLDAANRQNG